MNKKLFIAYISSNKHTVAFDSARASSPGRAIAILKRRYPEWKDLTLWAEFDFVAYFGGEDVSHD